MTQIVTRAAGLAESTPATADLHLERSNHEVWAKALKIVSQTVTQPSFEAWVKPLSLKEISNAEVVVAAANDFSKDMINSRFLEPIQRAVATVLRKPVKLRIVVDPGLKVDSYTPSLASISVDYTPEQKEGNAGAVSPFEQGQVVSPRKVASPPLNSKYTFETFVVGAHNQFSHAAAQAVAERPGQSYNPLFIYGGVGLGKTHLMQAIGHKAMGRRPESHVLYITCERFTNELINSIGETRMVEFRRRYRQLDVLLVDDIHFIQGKERTQEEFFHTFNALRDYGHQIVLSSDRPPRELPDLDERLRSRFEWGLIADVQPPDFETRIAILRKKCSLEKMAVTDAVLEYIASIYTANIRELEGALIRAHAYVNLTNSPMTVEGVKGVIQSSAPTRAATPTMDQLIRQVALEFRVAPADIKSARRSEDLTLPRHIAMYLAKEIMDMSFPRIGEAFGNRKHTSALHAYKKIKTLMMEDTALTAQINQLIQKLTG